MQQQCVPGSYYEAIHAIIALCCGYLLRLQITICLTSHIFSIIEYFSYFLYLFVFPICIFILLCLVISYSMHIYALFGAVTCIFLANILAIFCQGNRSGYIGVCKNYKIKNIRNTNSGNFAHMQNGFVLSQFL